MEITLRVIFHESMNFDIEMWKYARAVKRLATDPAIGHEHTPGTRAFLMGADVQINEHGYQDASFPAVKPGEIRVAMLGDSLTFGWGGGNKRYAAGSSEREIEGQTPGLTVPGHQHGGRQLQYDHGGLRLSGAGPEVTARYRDFELFHQ